MVEAKSLDILSYPIVYIKKRESHFFSIDEIFLEGGIVASINSSNLAIVLGVNYNPPNSLRMYNMQQNGLLIRQTSIQSPIVAIATREDEKIIFFFSTPIGRDYSNASSESYRYIIITNYGNIVSEYVNTHIKVTNVRVDCKSLDQSFSPYQHRCNIAMEGWDTKSYNRTDPYQISMAFDHSLLPERHVRVPQVFINVLSIFSLLLSNPQIAIVRGENQYEKEEELRKELNNRFKFLCNEYMREHVEHEALKTKCEALERENIGRGHVEHEALKTKYEALKTKYEALERENINLKKKLSEVRESVKEFPEQSMFSRRRTFRD